MDTGELKAVLESAGLSQYQANAYVTLLEHGSASASDLADASGVPGPRIYDVLRDLEDEGYVVTYEQDRLYARATDPEEALSGLRAQINQYETAVDEIQHRWQEPDSNDHEITLIRRFRTVLDRARADIESAERHVQLAVAPEQFIELRPLLADAHDRGVYIQISLYVPPDEDLPFEESAFEGTCTEARRRELQNAFFLLTDRTRLCFAPHVDSSREYGVLAQDRDTAYVFHWFFLTCLWEVYPPIHVDRDDTPPFVFVAIRECIRFIEPLLSDGATIAASVEGYHTGSGRERTLSGTITGVDITGEGDRDGPITLAQLAGRASFVLETDEGSFTIGGEGAVIEDIGADRITIEAIDGVASESEP